MLRHLIGRRGSENGGERRDSLRGRRLSETTRRVEQHLQCRDFARQSLIRTSPDTVQLAFKAFLARTRDKSVLSIRPVAGTTF